MRPFLMIPTAALALAVSSAAMAQVPPYPWSQPGTHPYQLDRQRQAMEAQRVRAAEQQALARQIALDRRLTVLELQAARTAPLDLYEPRRLGTVAEERAAREAATRRREEVVAGTSQIDAWLERPR